MTAMYELWDFESGNQIGAYTSEAAALEDVRDSLVRYGERSIDSLLLGCERDGHTELIAKGADLLARARAAQSSKITNIARRPSGGFINQRTGIPRPRAATVAAYILITQNRRRPAAKRSAKPPKA